MNKGCHVSFNRNEANQQLLSIRKIKFYSEHISLKIITIKKKQKNSLQIKTHHQWHPACSPQRLNNGDKMLLSQRYVLECHLQ